MDTLRLVAALIVGLAFLVAGASKIAAGPQWPAQAAGLGAPRWAVPIVPAVELVLGALLVTQFAVRPAALASAALLVAFTALIVRRLSQGRRPPCACFGAWSAKPTGASHVVRNLALLACAIVAAT